MDRFSCISAFVTVVDAGSFSAAAEQLGIAKSIVSRRVTQLEQHLGSRLLHRTTRSLALTDAGRNLYQRGRQILADLDEAERSITDEASELSGRIRLAAPLSFGLQHLSGAIADFIDTHPAIEIDLDLNDRNVNLVEEGFDMAVRIGELEDSTLVARRLGQTHLLVCASADYLERFGTPEHPHELDEHTGLQYSNISIKQQWTFPVAGGGECSARPKIRLRANNGEALAVAAARGQGIVSGPSFILGPYVRQGQLVELLADHRRTPPGIYALYPPGRLMPRRVQLLSDFLSNRFGDQPS